HARVGIADDGFSGAGCLIARRIENDPKLIEVSADGFAEFGTVFTDTGRKDDGVRTIQLEEITAHPLPRAGHEHIDRELGSDVTLSCGILNVANIVRDAAQTFQAGFLAKLPVNF